MICFVPTPNSNHENKKREREREACHPPSNLAPFQALSPQPKRQKLDKKLAIAWKTTQKRNKPSLLMELRGGLEGLIERAGALHDGISEEINNSYSLCRLCSENGRFCGIVETPFLERQRLIAIRESLKEVWDLLLLLQRLRSWQPIDRHEALTRLEESRLALVEKMTQYQGRSLDVVNQLNACFNNGKTAFDWNCLTRKMAVQKVNPKVDRQGNNRRGTGFFVSCLGMLFNPWRWHKTGGVAARLVVVFASISSTVNFYNVKQRRLSSQKRGLLLVDTAEVPPTHSILLSQDNCLSVFSGRG